MWVNRTSWAILALISAFCVGQIAGLASDEQPDSRLTMESRTSHRASKVENSGSTDYPANKSTVLIGMGDSLTHGTMDATNNDINTLHAYLQLVADSLNQATPVFFSQQLFDQSGERIAPREIPTNLGVDGAEIFSMEGIEYYKRVGAEESFVTESYLCDVRLARKLDDKYDRVLYPINLEVGKPVSQIDSAIWLVNEYVAA